MILFIPLPLKPLVSLTVTDTATMTARTSDDVADEEGADDGNDDVAGETRDSWCVHENNLAIIVVIGWENTDDQWNGPNWKSVLLMVLGPWGRAHRYKNENTITYHNNTAEQEN